MYLLEHYEHQVKHEIIIKFKEVADYFGIHHAYDAFDHENFVVEAMELFPKLALKKRMSLLRELIKKHIQEDYKTTLEILERSLKYKGAEKNSFVYGAYQDYIMVYGCTDDYVMLSLDYIRRFTRFFSGEFAIRTFINNYPKETFEAFLEWSISHDDDERRLASEGLRPKLPWAIGIKFDYKNAIQVLDNLYDDSERYVTRSVANHLNDISKLDPDLVVETLIKWQSEGKQKDKEMTYIKHHALRTSIKKGHVKTLAFLGYKADPNIEIRDAKIAVDHLVLNDFLEFSFDIEAHENLSLMIDYTVNYPMAGNKRSDKVFKIKKISLNKNECASISKRHQFKAMTTKKLYTGTYKLSLKINGTHIYIGEFFLDTKA